MSFISAAASRATLDRAIQDAAPHLVPLLQAVRDRHVGMLFVPQGSEPFRMPARPENPAIIIIGDDLNCALGPSGFHRASVRRAVRSSHCFAVISGAPRADVYRAIATTAEATRQSALIVETRLEQEFQWVSLITKLAPRRPLILSTVQGGRA